MSGELFQLTMERLLSAESSVRRGGSSSAGQPSSKGSRSSREYRELRFETAPRPFLG
jgi:hypothetical protein